MDSKDQEVIVRIERAVAKLAQREYSRVWIGEPGMTPVDLLNEQNADEQLRREGWEQMTSQQRKELFAEMPESLRESLADEIDTEEPPERWDDLPEQVREEIRHPLEVEPGEFVAIEGTSVGIQVPKVSYEYFDGLWVMENMRDDLDESVGAELHREVLYIYAAKQGMVPTIEDSKERYEAGLPPIIRRVPIEDLTSEHLRNIQLEEMEFYVQEPEAMGPYVIEDSEQSRRALAQRLGG